MSDLSDRNDPLGERMKRYEFVTRHYLPRRTYTLIRVDGRAFHTFTRGMERPFDARISKAIDQVGIALAKEFSGARFTFQQSDEVSILLTDFDDIHTEPMFGGVLQKLCSTASAIATGEFLGFYPECHLGGGFPTFDARVWQIPDPTEVENYFIWRQQDATRNSIQMVGQTYFSQRELHGVSTSEIQEKLWSEHQVNWNDYSDGFKRGRVSLKTEYMLAPEHGGGIATQWTTYAPPVFTQERDFLSQLIPRYE